MPVDFDELARKGLEPDIKNATDASGMTLQDHLLRWRKIWRGWRRMLLEHGVDGKTYVLEREKFKKRAAHVAEIFLPLRIPLVKKS